MPPRKPCLFFAKNKCSNGMQCPFSHDLASLATRSVCQYFLKGNCTYGENCANIHALGLRNASPEICWFFMQGDCKKGEGCPYSHDRDIASPQSTPQMSDIVQVSTQLSSMGDQNASDNSGSQLSSSAEADMSNDPVDNSDDLADSHNEGDIHAIPESQDQKDGSNEDEEQSDNPTWKVIDTPSSDAAKAHSERLSDSRPPQNLHGFGRNPLSSAAPSFIANAPPYYDRNVYASNAAYAPMIPNYNPYPPPSNPSPIFFPTRVPKSDRDQRCQHYFAGYCALSLGCPFRHHLNKQELKVLNSMADDQQSGNITDSHQHNLHRHAEKVSAPSPKNDNFGWGGSSDVHKWTEETTTAAPAESSAATWGETSGWGDASVTDPSWGKDELSTPSFNDGGSGKRNREENGKKRRPGKDRVNHLDGSQSPYSNRSKDSRQSSGGPSQRSSKDRPNRWDHDTGSHSRPRSLARENYQIAAADPSKWLDPDEVASHSNGSSGLEHLSPPADVVLEDQPASLLLESDSSSTLDNDLDGANFFEDAYANERHHEWIGQEDGDGEQGVGQGGQDREEEEGTDGEVTSRLENFAVSDDLADRDGVDEDTDRFIEKANVDPVTEGDYRPNLQPTDNLWENDTTGGQWGQASSGEDLWSADRNPPDEEIPDQEVGAGVQDDYVPESEPPLLKPNARKPFHCLVTYGEDAWPEHIVTPFESESIFIYNIPLSIEEGELANIIARFGSVLETHVEFATNGDNYHAKVKFSSSTEAVDAVRQIHKSDLNSSGFVVQAVLDSSAPILYDWHPSHLGRSVKLSFPNPSRSAWVYFESMSRFKEAEALNGTVFNGRKITIVKTERPKKSVNVLRVDGLPLSAEKQDVSSFFQHSTVVEMIHSTYTSISVDALLGLLRRHGELEDPGLDFLPSPTKARTVAFARFTDAASSAEAVQKLNNTVHEFLDGGRLNVQETYYSDYRIAEQKRSVIRSDLDSLRAHYATHVPGIKLQESDNSVGDVVLRIYGSEQVAFHKARRDLDLLVRGETILDGNDRPLWDEYFDLPSSSRQIDQMNENNAGSFFLERDFRRRHVLIFGNQEGRALGKKSLHQLLEKVQKFIVTFEVPDADMGNMLRAGKYSASDKVYFHFPSRTLTLRGNPEDRDKTWKTISQPDSFALPPSPTTEESCMLCLSTPSDLISLDCCHAFCKECLCLWIKSLNGPKFSPLRCIATVNSSMERCSATIPYKLVKQILSEEEENDLLEMSFLTYIWTHEQEYKLCPTYDCTMVYTAGDPGTAIRCPACRTWICTSCQVELHEGLTCSEYQSL
ncbi:hypothetical protein BDP27DRAFT_1446405 [Rhodocollybia butyracea]|uniref:RING-type E3 ubiquitin transferase n=1 Tax=Rhodocollybia butyracea TaxID=206335 RepID=A0A9P5PS88_9AGAR|nr:hypothetical protein BDP27DRAFT_1446405 [Rhodocollybia butyracea]